MELYIGLLSARCSSPELLFTFHLNEYLNQHNLGVMTSSLFNKCQAKLHNHGISPPLRTQDVDILHSTYFLGLPPKLSSTQRLVSTLHDVNPDLYPEFYTSNSPNKKVA